jgi:TRAP-type uncharacterized transport system substrate-binding protein
MKRLIGFMALALALVGGHWMNPSQAAERTPIILGTATPGGGFELYGGVLAEVVNSTDASLNVLARNTRGSRQNIPLLEQGTLDVALVASLPAREAFEGIERDAPTPLKIITAIYPTFRRLRRQGGQPGEDVLRSGRPEGRLGHQVFGPDLAWAICNRCPGIGS